MAAATVGDSRHSCAMTPPADRLKVNRSEPNWWQVISNMDMGSDLFMVHLQEVKIPVKMIK
jgi:hypothetical protein